MSGDIVAADGTGPMPDRLLADIDAILDGPCMLGDDSCLHRNVAPWQARAMRDEIKRLRAALAQPGH